MAGGKKPRIRKSREKPASRAEPVVNEFTAQHGTYGEATIVDLGNELGGGRQKTYRVMRNLYPTIVDRWLAEGGPGFDEPQRRAVDHCRALWACAGTAGRLVANYGGMGGGDSGRERDSLSQTEALTQLAEYKRRIPPVYWNVFENMARDEFSALRAGEVFGGTESQWGAHAKASVGFVASLIAMWRGF